MASHSTTVTQNVLSDICTNDRDFSERSPLASGVPVGTLDTFYRASNLSD